MKEGTIDVLSFETSVSSRARKPDSPRPATAFAPFQISDDDDRHNRHHRRKNRGTPLGAMPHSGGGGRQEDGAARYSSPARTRRGNDGDNSRWNREKGNWQSQCEEGVGRGSASSYSLFKDINLF